MLLFVIFDDKEAFEESILMNSIEYIYNFKGTHKGKIMELTRGLRKPLSKAVAFQSTTNV